MILITFTLSLLAYTLNALPISQADGKTALNGTHATSPNCTSSLDCISPNATVNLTATAPDQAIGSNWQPATSVFTVNASAPSTGTPVHITNTPINHTLNQGATLMPSDVHNQSITLAATNPTLTVNGVPENCGNSCTSQFTVHNLTVMSPVTAQDPDN
jgi:hypothetical protein